MGTLRAIQITKVHAVTTDDSSVDEVYYFSTIRCGSNDGSGTTPPSSVPSMTSGNVTKSTARTPMEVEQGVDAIPHTSWGLLYPNGPVHEECCIEGRGEVSGSIYFIDSDQPDPRWLTFGIIVASLISVGVAALVTSAMAPTGPVAGVAGGAAGVATGLGLSRLWGLFLNAIGRDDYLGGVRVSFPCTGTGQVVQTHQLVGASALALSAPKGRPSGLVRGSSSARYSVTIRATYN